MEDKHESNFKQGRRDMLKTLATLPVLGAMAYGIHKKRQLVMNTKSLDEGFNVGIDTDSVAESKVGEKTLRIGIIGVGIRGKQILRSCGFADPAFLQKKKEDAKKDPKNTYYEEYLKQEDLNIRITAVCDIFSENEKVGVAAASNLYRNGVDGKMDKMPKVYKTYHELLADPDIDGVIIATPDHWHSTMAIDAAKAGKHVYVEKPLSWTVPETYEVREAVKNSGIVFQLGHQNRQTANYRQARRLIDRGVLGHISLIEMCTNRNSPNGAWVYKIHEKANAHNIDWAQFMPPKARWEEYCAYMKQNKLEQFMGPEPIDQFSLERFFRWRCWWDYSTGLSGDLLTHEYDCINQIMDVGIPSSATSSGGVYYFKDGRTVPDVLHTTFEFAEKGLTLLYSATLASSKKRSKVIMGSEASMEIGSSLMVSPDANSKLYKTQLKSGQCEANSPMYTYTPGQEDVDTVTSATERYFAERGLLHTFVNGKKYDATFLHVKEWLESIRGDLQPSCNIDRAFEEAMTAHLGTRSYLERRTMFWDKDKEIIVKG